MKRLLILTSRPLDTDLDAGLRASGWEIDVAEDAGLARRLIERCRYPVGLLLFWPEDDELHWSQLRNLVSGSRRIRWTAALHPEHMQRDACVALIAECLYNYVRLPLDVQQLSTILRQAHRMAEMDDRFLESQRGSAEGRFGLIGTSARMDSLYRDMENAARSEVPVIVSGETGCGKEAVARAIHGHSSFSSDPFVALGSNLMPPSQLQRELYAAGRPLTASGGSGQRGHAAQDCGGTLFLDEVGELAPEAQAGLLHFLESGPSERRLGTGHQRLATRVIAATSHDLESLIRQDRFRIDLYFRLQILSLTVPPLRDREGDVQPLARYFLDEILQAQDSRALGFSRSALAVLDRYDWPGNIRELRNRVHQAALCARGAYISPGDLRLEHRSEGRDQISLQEAREAAERQTICSALKRNKDNLSRAARELCISRMTLYRLLSKHDLSREKET